MTCIGFIGLGLIGGSLARSIKKFHPDFRVLAYSHTRSTLDQALEAGAIDEALSQNDPRFGNCDFIFLCAPVQTNITYLPFLKSVIRKDCILTDVGSVKGETTEAAVRAGLAQNFIGGHPMAGTEKTGFANSTDYLLENAYYFITTNPQTDSEKVLLYSELVRSIRSLPIVVSAEEHDYIVAGVSHLEHIVASSLVNTVKSIDTPDEKMKLVAAGGFRDITRIASSSPVMWQQICLANRDDILSVLDRYMEFLSDFRSMIDSGDTDGLYRTFSSSKDYRDSIDDIKRGSVPRQYLLYVDIYDEPGGIATVTTLLAMNQISIKNIGIIHNREFEDGVLRIEFYDEKARNAADDVLKKRNYLVRRKV
ncbi:MAG: prephenate dehydrogenase/arogenate dehydrogenase family protein [Bilifractor sp.]|jgi:prephenate dehydrogenase